MPVNRRESNHFVTALHRGLFGYGRWSSHQHIMVDVTDKEMDNPTFRSDTVLSDVHLYCPNKRHLMVRLNAVGQPGNVCLD